MHLLQTRSSRCWRHDRQKATIAIQAVETDRDRLFRRQNHNGKYFMKILMFNVNLFLCSEGTATAVHSFEFIELFQQHTMIWQAKNCIPRDQTDRQFNDYSSGQPHVPNLSIW